MKGLLKQYKNIIEEIKNLKKRIKKIQRAQKKWDSVKGSNPYFPYEENIITIEGYGVVDPEELNRLHSLLQDRKKKCGELKVQIEEFISKIPNSRIRCIFQYRYIDEMEWLPISRRVGGYDESFARKIHDRYLEGLM